MIDASFSRQKHQEDLAARARRRRPLIPLVAAFLLAGAGLSLVWGFGGTAALVPSPTREAVSNEILETTKGLQSTQQQAVDQLQVVQDQLAAQQVETKELSGQIAALTEKLDALKQSVADIPTPSVAAPVPLPQPSKARGK
jgi:Tfp pilus assembly protein PilN